MKAVYYVAQLVPLNDPYSYWHNYSIDLLSIGFDTEILAEEALLTQPSLKDQNKHYIIQKVYEI